ncbi:Phenylpyruvate tautomerase [Bertholletia excelsa]
MPCLDISTNVNLDGVDTDSVFSEATKAVASIMGKPENYVMVLLKEPAAFAEVVSMGGINSEVKRKLIAAIGAILEEKLSIPRSRFFLKVHDTTAGRKTSKM